MGEDTAERLGCRLLGSSNDAAVLVVHSGLLSLVLGEEISSSIVGVVNLLRGLDNFLDLFLFARLFDNLLVHRGLLGGRVLIGVDHIEHVRVPLLRMLLSF